MTITYPLGRGLYVNITNRCDCDCSFCIRHSSERVGSSGSLWLEREPTVREILDDIAKNDTADYDELVFCGFGEPTERLDDLLRVASELKKRRYPLPIRLNTNGHASLLAGKDAAPLFEGLFDVISISLNAKNAAEYAALCRPAQGERAFYAMLDFAASVRAFVPSVAFTVVDTLPKEDLRECRSLAESVGIPLRVRAYTEAYE